jgi:hypothetical protein
MIYFYNGNFIIQFIFLNLLLIRIKGAPRLRLEIENNPKYKVRFKFSAIQYIFVPHQYDTYSKCNVKQVSLQVILNYFRFFLIQMTCFQQAVSAILF